MHKEQFACLQMRSAEAGQLAKLFETWKSSLLEMDAVFDTIAKTCPSQ
jgi:hypothetical protein